MLKPIFLFVVLSLTLINTSLVMYILKVINRSKNMKETFTANNYGTLQIPGNLQVTGTLNAKNIGKDLVDNIYPIGSILFTVDANSPNKTIGGIWERYAKGKCLFSVDEDDPDLQFNATGGSKNITLTTEQIPAHSHKYYDLYRHIRYGHNGGDGALGQGGWIGAAKQNRSTVNTGGNLPHENMPPYIAVYCWKRIK